MAGGQAAPVPGVSGPVREGPPSRRVRVLPPEVANRIAAGEVVERPASAVKELVENALDAGAHRIGVEIEAAGTELIAVVDDGEGMTAEDAVCAFSRHATSKVRSADDLQRITTLGFRGEALASIAAVSSTTLVTRRTGDLSGVRVEVVYGAIKEVRETGAPPGTRVEVAGLFENTPARRKFLKTPATEVGHVSEFITRTALARPQVGFTLRHGRRTLIEYAPVEEDADRIRQVFGPERAAQLLPFTARSPVGWAAGWVGHWDMTFPTQRQIHTYVNRRHVRDKLVNHGVVAGYSTLLMHGRYPAAVVFLDLSPEEVDVNVHPAKSEVRFRRSGAVHELLSHAVQARLRDEARRRTGAVLGSGDTEARGAPAGAASSVSHSPLSLRLVETVPAASVPPAAAAEREAAAPLPAWGDRLPPSMPAPSVGPRETQFGSLRVVGQVFEGFVICERDNRLILVDQHAAHERVTFERLRAAYGGGAVARQQLLLPAVVEMSPREAALLGERSEELDALGFEIEPFGGASISVRALPALLGDCDPGALLHDLAEELAEIGRSRRLTEAAEAVLARVACHSAVRAGQNLGPDEIRALLREMDQVDFSTNCPHGRPAYITLSRGELERWFKRT